MSSLRVPPSVGAMPLTMKLTLRLAGVTYGELYDYVDAARAAGVPADESVRCLGSDEEGDRFEVDLAGREGSVSHAAASGAGGPARTGGSGAPGEASPPHAVAEFLRRSLRSEADVDKVMSMLADMRRFFR